MLQRRSLPPLLGIRAFEAAARLGSFVAAAEELCVTPSAVSQQVKGLEEWLGQTLFQRQARGLALTERGRRYMAALGEALDGIHRATQTVRRPDRPGALTISTVHSFAAHWLAPRLHRFADLHPDLDLRVSANTRVVDFAVEAVDAAIRFGAGPYPGLRAELLVEERVTPMCSPRLLAEQPLRRPEDLAGHTLLHDESGFDLFPTLGWHHWLSTAGVAAQVPAERGPVFSDNHLSLLAARAGRGVALGRLVLAGEDLALGDLVAPFPPVDTGLAYRFVAPPERWDAPHLAAFRTWLKQELVRHII